MQIDPHSLLGMTKEKAIETVKATGMRVRVRREDKRAFTGTMDYRTDRINLQIDDGIVSHASIG